MTVSVERLTEFLDLTDFERAAAERVEPALWDFVSGGAGTEQTVAANLSAWRRVGVVPRVLNDVSRCTTRTALLGSELGLPLGIAPMAYQRLLHPEGELAAAEAARDTGAVYVAGLLNSCAVEEIAAVGAITWFQLYWLRDRRLTEALLERAEAAGCRAVVITVDVPRMGRRLRDVRSGFTVPPHIRAANLPTGEQLSPAHHGRAGASSLMVHTTATFDPCLSWRDLEWLRGRTRLPLVVKGILDPDDAVRAVGVGADAVVVSNHGGRQLDGAVVSATALPAVYEALPDHVPVLVDGGIRSGVDVLRALALGASAVLIGRPALWGLAVGGAAGVRRVLALLARELEDGLALSGCSRPAEAAALRTTLLAG
ncbi:Hydroxymandelate oxidase [Kitasatospora sp. MMS16-BH015]|uniref:alpha-hydroxy acid oxidase n=1 Tax=Kitasatospora sp. MMS16-BH015 TaxID=2018025 RepID=UPI000CA1246B|nr:alpha-hydroxy acid oxidase [Kitasatospora sp. MMS16-BH015]AUG76122.1 Hydroxymandelate oxidase [Kitasatospora sp. MMS16-BH015]